MDYRRGFEEIVHPETFEEPFARMPIQPDGKSRVWGANSFALLPMFRGAYREDVAQQCGFRMPVSPGREKRTHSGLRLTAAYPDAAAAAPGFVSHAKEGRGGIEASTVHTNAVILGKLFVQRFGNCTHSGEETQVLVGNALGYADRYALEAGFRRCTSRLGSPKSRASWFARDVPSGPGNAEWDLYEAGGVTYLPPFYCVAPYRVAEGMPRSDALCGSLSGQGYLYQYAFRFAALAQLLVSAWLTPTVSYGNHVISTEVVTRAMEACHRLMCTGSHETQEVEKYDNGSSPRAYN